MNANVRDTWKYSTWAVMVTWFETDVFIFIRKGSLNEALSGMFPLFNHYFCLLWNVVGVAKCNLAMKALGNLCYHHTHEENLRFFCKSCENLKFCLIKIIYTQLY